MHKGWVLPSKASGWAQTRPWLGSSDSSHICRGEPPTCRPSSPQLALSVTKPGHHCSLCP